MNQKFGSDGNDPYGRGRLGSLGGIPSTRMPVPPPVADLPSKSRYPGPSDPGGVPRRQVPIAPQTPYGTYTPPSSPTSFMTPGGGLNESDVLETIFKQLGL